MSQVIKISAKKPVTLDIEGKKYDVFKPTLAVALEYEKAGEDKSSKDRLLDMLSSLGLPKELLLTLDTDQLTEVAGAISPAKKP